MTLFVYQSKYPLGLISKYASEDIKLKYKEIMNLLLIRCTETDIEFNSWFKSIIPLLTAYEFNKAQLGIMQKVGNQNKTRYLNNILKILPEDTVFDKIINIGEESLFIDKDKFKFPLNESYVNNYSLTKTYRFFSNIMTIAEASIFNIEEYNAFLESVDKVKNIRDRLFFLERCKANSLETVLSEQSFYQEKDIQKYTVKAIHESFDFEIEINKGSSKEDISDSLLKIFNKDYSQATGSKLNEFLIQIHGEITSKYSMIVVNGELVCGSGKIEMLSPLDNEEHKFDLRVLNSNNEIIEDRDLVSYYISTAEEIVKQFKNEGFNNYVLELGLIEGGISIISLKELKNIDLYAFNYKLIFEAFTKL